MALRLGISHWHSSGSWPPESHKPEQRCEVRSLRGRALVVAHDVHTHLKSPRRASAPVFSVAMGFPYHALLTYSLS